MKLVLFFVLFFLIITPHEKPALWVEIHDVSPAYGDGRLTRVIDTLERHNVERVVIFVIPNHAGSAPLSEHKEFTDYLLELESRGYEIGAHGYTHDGLEFNCPESEARERLDLGKEEFHSAGFAPQVFLAPRFLVSDESLPMLEENFEEIYFFNKIIKGKENHDYFFHEFTYIRLPGWVVMPIAKASYYASRSDVYRLSVHVGETDEEGLQFLDEFLGFTDVKNA